METQNNQSTVPSATNTNDTVFSDVVDIAPYQKSLKAARIWLYVVAGLQAAVGIYEYTTIKDKELALLAGGIDFGIAILFLLFALWSYKKPAVAFMSALITYVVIHAGLSFLEPENIFRGVIIKILVIVALVKGYNNAREVEKLKEAVGEA